VDCKAWVPDVRGRRRCQSIGRAEPCKARPPVSVKLPPPLERRKSSFFPGPGRFTLRLDGDRIREMRVAEK
jgi:hypothetical protein